MSDRSTCTMINQCNICDETEETTDNVTEYLMEDGSAAHLCDDCVREQYAQIVKTMDRDPI